MPSVYRRSDELRAVDELATDDDLYRLRITAIRYRRHNTSREIALLSFSVEVAEGPSSGRRLTDIDVVNPEEDYFQAGRIVMSALGYRPGIDDSHFAHEHPDDDFTLCSDSGVWEIGSGYAALIGMTFSARVRQSRDQETKAIRHSYEGIEPIGSLAQPTVARGKG